MESYNSQSGLDKLSNSGPCLTVILKKAYKEYQFSSKSF